MKMTVAALVLLIAVGCGDEAPTVTETGNPPVTTEADPCAALRRPAQIIDCRASETPGDGPTRGGVLDGRGPGAPRRTAESERASETPEV